jgi:hypothetical protein
MYSANGNYYNKSRIIENMENPIVDPSVGTSSSVGSGATPGVDTNNVAINIGVGATSSVDGSGTSFINNTINNTPLSQMVSVPVPPTVVGSSGTSFINNTPQPPIVSAVPVPPNKKVGIQYYFKNNNTKSINIETYTNFNPVFDFNYNTINDKPPNFNNMSMIMLFTFDLMNIDKIIFKIKTTAKFNIDIMNDNIRNNTNNNSIITRIKNRYSRNNINNNRSVFTPNNINKNIRELNEYTIVFPTKLLFNTIMIELPSLSIHDEFKITNFDEVINNLGINK